MDLKTILIIALLVLAGVGFVLLLGYFQYQPFDIAYNTVAGWFGGFDVAAVVSNPATIIAAAGPALAVGGAALGKINSIKQKATTEVNTAKASVDGLTSSLSETKTQLETSNLNLEQATQKLNTLEASSKTYTDQINQLQQEKHDLTVQLQALNNIQAKATVLAENKEVVRTVIK